VRIVVDLNRCQGYAQCCFLAPDVFRLQGEEALVYRPNPEDGRAAEVRRAAVACPVQAILVEEPGLAEEPGLPAPGNAA
jgi:ferredoxin